MGLSLRWRFKPAPQFIRSKITMVTKIKYFLYFCILCISILFAKNIYFENFTKNKDLEHIIYEFSSDGDVLYFNNNKIKNSHALSFEKISYRYFKDKNQVYYRIHNGQRDCLGRLLMGELYGMIFPYFHLIIIAEAAPDSFESINYNDNYAFAFARDKYHVYVDGIIIDGADSLTFNFINSKYQSDKNQVYFRGQFLNGADPNSFQTFQEYACGKDNKHVYWAGNKIIGADATSFKHIKGGYSKDRTHVFFGDTIIENAEPESFKVLDGFTFASDNNYVYKKGVKIEDVTPDNFGLNVRSQD